MARPTQCCPFPTHPACGRSLSVFPFNHVDRLLQRMISEFRRRGKERDMSNSLAIGVRASHEPLTGQGNDTAYYQLAVQYHLTIWAFLASFPLRSGLAVLHLFPPDPLTRNVHIQEPTSVSITTAYGPYLFFSVQGRNSQTRILMTRSLSQGSFVLSWKKANFFSTWQ